MSTSPAPEHPVRQHQVLPRPAETPAAIRAVLAANADPGITERFDQALDEAFAQARDSGDIAPLLAVVRRWWFEAENWCDPDTHRARLAQWGQWALFGPPPRGERLTREQVRERYGV
jgi:hypothetical protein